MKTTNFFTSKYLLKQQRTESTPTINTIEISDKELTDVDNVSDYSNNESDFSMAAIGSSRKEETDNGRIEVDYETTTDHTASIHRFGNQLTGDNYTKTESDGKRPVRREYSNKKRSLFKDVFPFASYENAQDHTYTEINEPDRRLFQIETGKTKRQETIDNLTASIEANPSKTKHLALILSDILNRPDNSTRGKTSVITFDLLSGGAVQMHPVKRASPVFPGMENMPDGPLQRKAKNPNIIKEDPLVEEVLDRINAKIDAGTDTDRDLVVITRLNKLKYRS